MNPDALALRSDERRILDALVERIFPAGKRNAGATAIGVGLYIDHAPGWSLCRQSRRISGAAGRDSQLPRTIFPR